MNSTAFWLVTPCSSEKARSFGGTYCLHLEDKSKSWKKPVKVGRKLSSTHSSNLMMDVVRSIETSDFLRTTWRHKPEDCTVYILVIPAEMIILTDFEHHYLRPQTSHQIEVHKIMFLSLFLKTNTM